MRGLLNILLLVLMLFALAILAVSSFVAGGLIPLYFILVFVGAAKREAKVKTKIEAMLMPDESVVASIIEYRAMALFRRRVSIVITTSRMISVRRKILGGYRMLDKQWKDLSNAQMDENIFPALFGTSLSFSFLEPEGSSLGVGGGSPKDAAEVYKYAQSQEQAWAEKRRIRGIEENRSFAGAINLGGLFQAAGGSSEVSPTDAIANEINSAKSLLASGVISDSEFQEIKSKILSRRF
ncbi:hypothetical protein PMI09_00584 [Rhizobium sp. CF122]|uniref:SHOCT domain-containing protein n=1 Tax=Rhizobium sp. CF122 TaxID=1144312 RepID=UPI0002718EAF|nr:SHOCT domain-containing protein [Rhizobium sp. CF122]EJL58091.1 hypothetical protein PMI09_00584 [Rhizobium sp. CF122]